ncbi:MAG: DUF3575 domain-containing protein [Bacteroidetes bacterium HGW-Bacteroidetes-8]|jgi:hypothetical protein|nr:MAG: DUF3575 domain-containing protein [Bacteroidetes bacterium HGW-Bacteroidetes-8]
MKKVLILSALLLFASLSVNAQSLSERDYPNHFSNNLSIVSSSTSSLAASGTYYEDSYKPKKNLLKLNLTAIPLRNYSVQFERVLGKRVSIAIAYRNMPEGNLPMKDFIIEQVGSEDQEAVDAINSFTLSNYAITPEIRFYMGKKGYGRGFYIAPFFRNASYAGGNLLFKYNDDNDVEQSITLSGDIKANTVGLLLGAQWSLSKLLVLDWWIIGPHYGNSKGELIGSSSRVLTADEQEEIRQNLEDFDIPMVKKTVSVDAGGAKMVVDGPWTGVRAGISLGIKF